MEPIPQPSSTPDPPTSDSHRKKKSRLSDPEMPSNNNKKSGQISLPPLDSNMTSTPDRSTTICTDQNNNPDSVMNNAEPGPNLDHGHPLQETDLQDSLDPSQSSSHDLSDSPTQNKLDDIDFIDIDDYVPSSTQINTLLAREIPTNTDDIDIVCRSDHTIESTSNRDNAPSYSQVARRN